MSDCNALRSPYRSGLTIDSIARDNITPDNKPEIIKPFQRMVGGLNWLSISTRPDLPVSMSLLSQFMQNPSSGHILAGKRVLAWLSRTRNHGLQYTQGGRFTEGQIGWVDKPAPTSFCETYTDANWGPQDASHPREDMVEMIPTDSVQSLLGHTCIRMGGPIAWGCTREPKTSRSSCKAEIFSMDEGCKTSEMLYHLMTDLKLPDVTNGIPMFNDNKGAVNWSQGCSVSKNLRHLNIREISVRDARNAGYVDIKHVPGHSIVSDIFTKEHKSDETFTQLAFQLIRPHDLSNKWTDILTPPTSDPGGCWKESGITNIVDILPQAACA
jgi:hypothetical protein